MRPDLVERRKEVLDFLGEFRRLLDLPFVEVLGLGRCVVAFDHAVGLEALPLVIRRLRVRLPERVLLRVGSLPRPATHQSTAKAPPASERQTRLDLRQRGVEEVEHVPRLGLVDGRHVRGHEGAHQAAG